MAALRGTGQEQSDVIGASDEKKKRDGGEEEPKRAARFADGGFFERLNADGEAGVSFRKLAAELGLNSGEVRAGLRESEAPLKATNNGEPSEFATLRIRQAGGDGRPKIDVAIGKEKRRRHDPDNGEQAAIEAKRLADDVGIGGEAATPKAVADDDGGGAVEGFLGAGEFAAERGRHGPDFEEMRI